MSAGLGVSEIGMHRVHQMVKNGKNVGKMHKNDEINLNIYVLFTKFVV